jgi:phospholipid/cholesterol/gamma-HCH transport system substrate-binding protein
MKATPSQKTKIGIFTVVGITVLVIGIFIIGNKKNMFGDTFSVYGAFKNVGGLMVGNNIRFAGINVGTVESIVIINDSTVRVDMRMQSKVQPFLKNDALASIGSDGLMGDKLVIITPGASGDKLIAEGGQIQTVNPVDFDKIINKFSNVADNAEVITASLAGISTQINSGKGSLGKLIYTDDLQKGLVGTVNSVQKTVESARDAIGSVKKGTEGFAENMEAAKHNFLLKGYFKKKEKEKAKKEADAAEKKQAKIDSMNGK